MPTQEQRQLKGIWLAAIGTLVGTACIAGAFVIAIMRIPLPYEGVLIYTGAALMAIAIGSTATINFEKGGQKVVAGGVTAAAIALSWLIGADKAAEIPRINMTYYVNFPDKMNRAPNDLIATVDIYDEQHEIKPRETRDDLHLFRGPGPDSVKFTVADVLARDSVILKVRSAKENKNWASGAMPVTESFQNFYEEP
jgi:hypothetical protein